MWFPVIVPSLLQMAQEPRRARVPYTGPCVCDCKEVVPQLPMRAAFAYLSECLCPCHYADGDGPSDCAEARLQAHERSERRHVLESARGVRGWLARARAAWSG